MTEYLHALAQGTELEGYRIERVLGVGGFGITYLGRDLAIGKLVAIKEYLPAEFAVRAEGATVAPRSGPDQDDYRWGLDRFLDEARTLANFDHPNLNRVFRFFAANGTAYMVLEYIEGQTLSRVLKEQNSIPEDKLLRIISDLLNGLQKVHEAGFTHRDIKPGNIMLRADGSAVLLDFGAARISLGQRSKSITTILTPGYAPIEQYDQQADDIGPWTDIYALGMVLYRCVSGYDDSKLVDAVARARMQQKCDHQHDLQPATSVAAGRYNESLLAAIDWAIRVDEGDRPQNVEAWKSALRNPVHEYDDDNNRTILLHPEGGPPGRTAPAGNSKKRVILAVAVLTVASILTGLILKPDIVMRKLPAQNEKPTLAAPATAKPEPEPAPAAVAAAIAADTVRELESQRLARTKKLLELAGISLAEKRYTTPYSNSAYGQFSEALLLDPGNQQARGGIAHLARTLTGLINDAIKRHAFGEARDHIAQATLMGKDFPELSTLQQKLDTSEVSFRARQKKQRQKKAALAATKKKEAQQACKRECRGVHYLCSQQASNSYHGCIGKIDSSCNNSGSSPGTSGFTGAEFGGAEFGYDNYGYDGESQQIENCARKAREQCASKETGLKQGCRKELLSCEASC